MAVSLQSRWPTVDKAGGRYSENGRQTSVAVESGHKQKRVNKRRIVWISCVGNPDSFLFTLPQSEGMMAEPEASVKDFVAKNSFVLFGTPRPRFATLGA